MAKKNSIEVHGRYFRWRLSKRKGVWQADGRGNHTNAGRHSLDTRDQEQALQYVHDLDVRIAVDFGIADRRQLQTVGRTTLEIPKGISLFEKHIERPEVAGGPKWELHPRDNRHRNFTHQITALSSP